MDLREQQIEVLETASEYIENVIAGTKEAIEKFHIGKESEGVSLVAQLTEGLDWLFQIIIRTRDIQKEPLETEVMKDKLQEVIESFENEDYILLGDLLEYEVLPILENWREGIHLAVDAK